MVILDVREPDEYRKSHIAGAINYSVRLLLQGSMPDIPKSEEIVTYCRSGGRAGAAMQILRQNGFTNVTNGGGLHDLLRAGYGTSS